MSTNPTPACADRAGQQQVMVFCLVRMGNHVIFVSRKTGVFPEFVRQAGHSGKGDSFDSLFLAIDKRKKELKPAFIMDSLLLRIH
jgi:hypothetical protein|mmetsp:Transcript_102021/g.172925  ORF Transcript_102021/g.172925 Transcript_102021/m.172925 type:complete len:85 (+) Transcript_102021:527-781(+)